MFNNKDDIKSLMQHFVQPGFIEWIGIRTERVVALKEVVEVNVSVLSGLPGDHYKGTNKKRQLTLIQKEHLQVVGSMLGREEINPQEVRRNVVVSGINLLALKDATFSLGTAVLKMTGLCHPCTRMEKNLGKGGYNAMRGHGGITCEILKDGSFKIGDALTVLSQD